MQEVWFWSCVWAIAAATGIASTIRDSSYSNFIDLVSVGLYSGFVGFSVVAIWVGGSGGHVGIELRCLGLSALLGLAGKSHDKIVRSAIYKLLGLSGEMREKKAVDRKHKSLGDDFDTHDCTHDTHRSCED